MERKLPPQLNHLEAIVVSAGGDSFAQIGSAKSGDGEGGGAELSGALVDGWVAMYADYFPVKASDAEAVVNLDDLQLLPEPSIDAAVHAKESAHTPTPTLSVLCVSEPHLVCWCCMLCSCGCALLLV